MEKENLDAIFKAYDIRGVYGGEFNEETFKKIAKATSSFLGAKKMLVAMDNRASSESLKNAVLEALSESDVDAIFIGVTTTPMFYWALNREDVDGGMMITASHNPPKYNGLKISKRGALPVGEDSGLLDIKKAVIENNFSEKDKKGSVAKKDLTEEYVDFLCGDLKNINLKVAADFSCGFSSVLLKKVAEKTHISLRSLCKMGENEKHEGNPLKEENVKDLQELMVGEEFDLGAAFDTDADRVFFFDKNGKRIDSGVIAAMLAEHYLSEDEKARFVGTVSISSIFKDAVLENKGEYFESRVGHVFLKQAMRENDATFGAELSGHYYFKDFYFADSGLFAFMKVLEFIKRSGKDLSEIVKKYDKYFRSGEVNFKVKDKEKALTEIKNFFKDGKMSYIDGVTIKYPDFWINIRASNTEPLLRVNIEAEDEVVLFEKIKQVEIILSK